MADQDKANITSLKFKDDRNPNGKQIVLLLQGGGALGAYQVGAYKALQEKLTREGCKLDWVAGISIGAINASVIAGHKDPDAVRELENLWREFVSPEFFPYDYNWITRLVPSFLRGRLASLEPKYGAWMWTAFNPWGQGQFFSSRVLNPFQNPWYAQWQRRLRPNELAFYDTGRLHDTLDRHVNWDSINQPDAIRLSLGVTRVSDGEVAYFSNFDSVEQHWPRKVNIAAEHVMASGALPPAFPPIEIDGQLYWDGGVSSNTPIEALKHDLAADCDEDKRDTLVFLIDLWDRKGPIPKSMDDVFWRHKSIQFGSRKKAAESVVMDHERKIQLAIAQAEKAKQHTSELKRNLEVCQVMFERPQDDEHPQFCYSDADFSQQTFDEMRDHGYRDMRRAIGGSRSVECGGNFGKLYRYGTYQKHEKTDEKLGGPSSSRID